jgi:glucose-1-phosphate cytidylyltransferase
MKVVLFCGGLGTRIREYSESVPKPMIPIGHQPILWHVMNYYSQYGHKDFVLCLGYKANTVKDFFLNYKTQTYGDCIVEGSKVEMLGAREEDWRVAMIDTGVWRNIGSRLWAVRDHVKNEEMFLANYSDGLSDLPLPGYIESFQRSDCIGQMISVPAPHAFHIVESDDDGLARRLVYVGESKVRINGGFFVFRPEIFDYIRPGEELVIEPFRRLIEKSKLRAHAYDGFWASMDTFKDKQRFEDMLAHGQTPWQVWKS